MGGVGAPRRPRRGADVFVLNVETVLQTRRTQRSRRLTSLFCVSQSCTKLFWKCCLAPSEPLHGIKSAWCCTAPACVSLSASQYGENMADYPEEWNQRPGALTIYRSN